MSVKFDFKVKATTSDLYIRLHVGLSRGKLSYSYYLYCWFLRIAPVSDSRRAFASYLHTLL